MMHLLDQKEIGRHFRDILGKVFKANFDDRCAIKVSTGVDGSSTVINISSSSLEAQLSQP